IITGTHAQAVGHHRPAQLGSVLKDQMATHLFETIAPRPLLYSGGVDLERPTRQIDFVRPKRVVQVVHGIQIGDDEVLFIGTVNVITVVDGLFVHASCPSLVIRRSPATKAGLGFAIGSTALTSLSASSMGTPRWRAA